MTAAFSGVRATLHERVTRHFVNDQHESEVLSYDRRSRPLDLDRQPAAGRRFPLLVPGTRTFLDGQGRLRLCPLLHYPHVEREEHGWTLTRVEHEVVLEGDLRPAWRVLELLDGRVTIDGLLAEVAPAHRDLAARLLAAFGETGVADLSGWGLRRFLTAASAALSLPSGPLDRDGVMRLISDGGYRRYDAQPAVPLPEPDGDLPPALAALREVMGERRTPPGFTGAPVPIDVLGMMLQTAWGVTEVLQTPYGEVRLRAYPSPGALYTIEPYVHVRGTAGLEEGLYHYRPADHALEPVRVPLPRQALVEATLQRDLVGSAGVVVLLTANFLRYQRKYGSRGFRVVAAEAGHVAHSVVLAATALGLQARPVGSFFEPDLHEVIGVDRWDEPFMLSVLIGDPAG